MGCLERDTNAGSSNAFAAGGRALIQNSSRNMMKPDVGHRLLAAPQRRGCRMGSLLKERARKPLIAADVGLVLPTFKHMSGVSYYVAEIREPWNRAGYQIFQVLLTEKEMLNAVAEWTSILVRSKP